MQYYIVEKANHLAVHGIFDTQERATKHLTKTIPMYCANGYFTDKTLLPTSFEIMERP